MTFFLYCRYLATGDNFSDIVPRFTLGVSAVNLIVLQTVNAITKRAMPLSLLIPTKQTWERMAKEVLTVCELIAVDGEHVEHFCPSNSGSRNFTYKKSFSSVLMAVVDAKYKFVIIDAGGSGSNLDSTME